ncbi:MAG: ribbon-helix-helix domain-containing protein [Desulfuromonadales bacterium]|nr:ribbon-helix-helix domain-containing protein [Desulfuromonadales bacterium]
MSTEKIAITIENKTLTRLDTLVKNRVFPSRSRLIQEAIREKLERLDRSRLARECAKLDEDFEKSLAEEDMAEELSEWPEY